MTDPWERLRHMTIDQLVTATKLSGSVTQANGWTTPEGWPFMVMAVVAKPGNERVLELAGEFHQKVSELGVPAAAAVRRDEP
jgi:hypothetical protein